MENGLHFIIYVHQGIQLLVQVFDKCLSSFPLSLSHNKYPNILIITMNFLMKLFLYLLDSTFTENKRKLQSVAMAAISCILSDSISIYYLQTIFQRQFKTYS